MDMLSKDLKREFIDLFEAPLAGRITAFLPFLHFSAGESAVIAHKYICELEREARQPVNLTPGPDQKLFGNVRLRVPLDAAVSRLVVAEGGYDQRTGARSIRKAAEERIESRIVESYLSVEEVISEGGRAQEYLIGVERVGSSEEIVVMALEGEKGKGDDGAAEESEEGEGTEEKAGSRPKGNLEWKA
jgi:ATP-dependent Clp protease ATP-binding subunit ClpA